MNVDQGKKTCQWLIKHGHMAMENFPWMAFPLNFPLIGDFPASRVCLLEDAGFNKQYGINYQQLMVI